MPTRRHLIALGAASVFVPSLVLVASASAWPDRTVHMVVPVAAGGPTDVNARILAEQLSKIWGQQVVIDNKGGAGTNIGNAFVAHSDPDGYTLLYGTSSLASNGALYRSLDYNPMTGPDADLAGREIPVFHVRAEFLPGQVGQRVYRLCEGSAGKARHGFSGHRKRATSRRTAIPANGRNSNDARALSRRSASIY